MRARARGGDKERIIELFRPKFEFFLERHLTVTSQARLQITLNTTGRRCPYCEEDDIRSAAGVVGVDECICSHLEPDITVEPRKAEKLLRRLGFSREIAQEYSKRLDEAKKWEVDSPVRRRRKGPGGIEDFGELMRLFRRALLEPAKGEHQKSIYDIMEGRISVLKAAEVLAALFEEDPRVGKIEVSTIRKHLAAT